jgi:hypothetical protein
MHVQRNKLRSSIMACGDPGRQEVFGHDSVSGGLLIG